MNQSFFALTVAALIFGASTQSFANTPTTSIPIASFDLAFAPATSTDQRAFVAVKSNADKAITIKGEIFEESVSNGETATTPITVTAIPAEGWTLEPGVLQMIELKHLPEIQNVNGQLRMKLCGSFEGSAPTFCTNLPIRKAETP